MVKFSRQLEAQLIPEWKEKFVNYRQLKKNVKKVKLSRPSTINAHSSAGDGAAAALWSAFCPVRNVISGCQHHHGHHPSSQQMVDDEEQYELELVRFREDEVKRFFEKLDEELDKVNNFYEYREAEFVERGEVLNKQLTILTDLKKILHDRRRLHHLVCSSDNSNRSSSSRFSSPF